jgi:acetyl esterase/lipase
MFRTIVCLLLLGGVALAETPAVISLWPGTAPGSESWTQTESENISERDHSLNVRNVTRPTLTVYLPSPALANGTAVVVCPGGGFVNLGMGKEGEEVARWLNSFGVAAFVLKYRLVRTDVEITNSVSARERAQAIIPLAVADAQRALRLVRSRAVEWGVARDRIGIMGFSAGGYLAISVALRHDVESRPDFVAPIYGGAPADLKVPADAPPLFLVHADDDERGRAIDNSIPVYAAWTQARIPAELHVYARGGHGFALRKRGGPVDGWTDRFREWLADQGLLKAAAGTRVEPVAPPK